MAKGASVVRLVFTIPGTPVPCARPRVTRRGTFEEPRSRAYKALVRRHATMELMYSKDWEPGGKGPFRLVLDVFRERSAGDFDNFAKGICDGMTKAKVWADDRYVLEALIRLHVDKANPRTVVLVETIDAPAGTATAPKRVARKASAKGA